MAEKNSLRRAYKKADEWITNALIGTGHGITNQLEGLYQMAAHPVQTAQGLYGMGRQAVSDPRAFGGTVANALVETGKRATSGPLGFGEVLGENLSPSMFRRNPLARNELITYHGSPHRINNVDEANPVGKFDLSKVGTGEGAQAYGHGIYLAENPNVARQYRDSFAIRNDAKVATEAGESLNVPGWVQRRMDDGEVDSVIADFSDRLKKMQEWKAESPQPWLVDEQMRSAERILKAANEFKAGKAITEPPAHFYTVDLPDEHIAKMLDWDAPLSEQPEAVRKAFAPYADEAAYQAGKKVEEMTVGEMIPLLGNRRSPTFGAEGRAAGAAALSEELRRAGIPGIKYFDGGSRAAGEGTRNFVIFDGDTAKILKRE